MTALSFLLHARRRIDRRGRVTRLLPPLWPCVVLALLVWGASCCMGADQPPVVNWTGHSRAEVMAGLGKPQSVLQRGDTEVLVYPKSVRVEIRNDQVVSFRSGSQAILVKGDGTRYTASNTGKVTRIEPPPAENPSPETSVASAPATAPSASTPTPTPAPPTASPAVPLATAPAAVAKTAAKATPPASTPDTGLVAMIKDGETDEGKSWTHVPKDSTSSTPGLDTKMLKLADNYVQHGQLSVEKTRTEPTWVKPVTEVVLACIRFGLALLVLRVAIGWVGLPCYMPDVAKVAAIFVVIREGVYGLGGLGGNWQWLHLFRASDIVSFLVLCGLLVRFKVALEGITALKIAIATEVASYFVMGAITLALIFGLGAIF